MNTCYLHGDTRHDGCPDCAAIRMSLELQRIYADIADARTRAQMEPLKEEWGKRDMSKDGLALSLAEMVEDIERWVVGEVGE